MKNIIKLFSLLIGLSLSAIPDIASADTVGKITIAGDAQLTLTQLIFANNSAVLTSNFFLEQ